MNIEATLEDLEAHGYFQSLTKPTRTKYTSRKVRVSFIDEDHSSLVISAPIQGRDFIAGFSSNANWRIFSTAIIHSVVFLDEGDELDQTELSVANLVEEKLLEVSIRISFERHLQDITGALSSFDGQWLTIGATLVPLASVKSITVENLSELL